MKLYRVVSVLAICATALLTMGPAVQAHQGNHDAAMEQLETLDEMDNRYLKVASDDEYVGKGGMKSKQKSGKGMDKSKKGKGKGMGKGKGAEKSDDKNSGKQDGKEAPSKKEHKTKGKGKGGDNEDDDDEMPGHSGKNGIGMMKEPKQEASMKKLGHKEK
jgi:hypothetical protein